MEEIDLIKERNRRVELDKAWETSFTRKIAIAIITYVVAGIWLSDIDASRPWLNALVPTVGFLLSQASLGFLKKWWLSKK